MKSGAQNAWFSRSRIQWCQSDNFFSEPKNCSKNSSTQYLHLLFPRSILTFCFFHNFSLWKKLQIQSSKIRIEIIVFGKSCCNIHHTRWFYCLLSQACIAWIVLWHSIWIDYLEIHLLLLSDNGSSFYSSLPFKFHIHLKFMLNFCIADLIIITAFSWIVKTLICTMIGRTNQWG